MIKTRKINSIEGFLELFKSWNFSKVDNKQKKKLFKDSSKHNILSGNLGNDIFLSRSGQVKIDNLDSCLNLVRSDFIVF